ncbi:hypothetical protein [Amycolatopsis samaneae]|uniref:DUF11 domain-containing protein n=1 Tax=Amycolatopsis samaneae TaxID=664691 RepID=A0ABW5GED5_9PSEU
MTDRPRYREGQRLDVGVLESEQDWLVEGRRRHDLVAHGPGIAHGLGLTTAATGVFVAPGVAVDEAGRTLVVPAPIRVPWKDVPTGAYALDLWLSYEETTTGDRTEEGVCVRIQRVMPGVAASSPADSLIALGRLVHHAGMPPYVPIEVPLSCPDAEAASVAAPSGAALRLGEDPVFAVDAPGPVRRLAVTGDATEVTGTLSAASGRIGGPIRFGRAAPAPKEARPWRWYRVAGEGLRVELAAPARTEVPEWYRFAVLTCRGGTPLAVDAGGTTTVEGDLEVKGTLVRTAPAGDPDDPRVREQLLGTWVDAVDVASRAVDARFSGPSVDPDTISVTLTPGTYDGTTLPYRVVVKNTSSLLVTSLSVVLASTVDGGTAVHDVTDGLALGPGTTHQLDKSVSPVRASGKVHVTAAALGLLPGRRLAYAGGVLDYQAPPPIH